MGCRFLMLLAFPLVFSFLVAEENPPVSGAAAAVASASAAGSGEFRAYSAIGFRLVRKP